MERLQTMQLQHLKVFLSSRGLYIQNSKRIKVLQEHSLKCKPLLLLIPHESRNKIEASLESTCVTSDKNDANSSSCSAVSSTSATGGAAAASAASASAAAMVGAAGTDAPCNRWIVCVYEKKTKKHTSSGALSGAVSATPCKTLNTQSSGRQRFQQWIQLRSPAPVPKFGRALHFLQYQSLLVKWTEHEEFSALEQREVEITWFHAQTGLTSEYCSKNLPKSNVRSSLAGNYTKHRCLHNTLEVDAVHTNFPRVPFAPIWLQVDTFATVVKGLHAGLTMSQHRLTIPPASIGWRMHTQHCGYWNTRQIE